MGDRSQSWSSKEDSQTLTFLVGNDSNGLFAVQPSIDSTGKLTYTPADNANGSASVTVKVEPKYFHFASSWAELVDYTEQDAAGSDLRSFVQMVERHGAAKLLEICERLTTEASADVTVSTAHRSKGREWRSVHVSSDFRKPRDGGLPPRADLMLAYVTTTRAKLHLQRGGLAWTIILTNGGVLNMLGVGGNGMIGLGTINASSASGGIGTIKVSNGSTSTCSILMPPGNPFGPGRCWMFPEAVWSRFLATASR